MRTIFRTIFLIFTFFIFYQNCDPEFDKYIEISVSSNSVSFGNINVNQYSDTTVTVTNSTNSDDDLEGDISIIGVGYSIQSGGGTYSLKPGHSKTVTIRFNPTAAQTYSGTLTINHNSENKTSPVNVQLSGTGFSSISISVAPSFYDFGNVTVNQTADKDITITNSSNSTSNLSGSVSLSGSGFSIVSGSGAYSLTPGQSKTVTVKFSPTADQTYNGTLSITHNATNTSSPVNVSLTGNGEVISSIMITVTPSSLELDFGNVKVNQTLNKDVTITNSSSSTSNLTGSVSISGSGFSIVTGGGSYTLTPGQSKTVTVKFSPTASQNYNGTLSISHNATNTSSPVNVSLTGNGEDETIIISVTPTSYDFGNVTVNQTDEKDITITNSSSSTSNLTGSVSLSGSGFSIVTGSGAYSLTPGQSKTVNVKFSPIAEQNYNGALSITHNATNTSSPISVPLSGTGVSTVIISVDPSSLNYGEVLNFHTTDKTLIISNSSNSTSNLTGNVSLSGSGFSIVSGSGTYTLTPSQSKTVTVRFSPTAAQTYNGTLSITHNASNTSSPISVPLTGTGVTQIVIDVNPTSIDFGTLLTDVNIEKSITISSTNLSTTTLTGNVSISGTYYSISSGEGSFSLQPNQSKEIKVKFTPTQEGTFSGNLSITHNGTNDTSPIDINLTGKRGKAVWEEITNQDSYICSYYPSEKYSTSSLLALGYDDDFAGPGVAAIFRPLFDFNFNEDIPVNSEILSAELKISILNAGEGIPFNIYVGMIKENWGASSVCWADQPGYNVLSNTTHPIFTINTNYYLDITDEVQYMVSNKNAVESNYNEGFILRAVNESGSGKSVVIYSNDESDDKAPKLNIKYIPIE